MNIDSLLRFLSARENQGSKLALQTKKHLQQSWENLTQPQKEYFLKHILQFASYDEYGDLSSRKQNGLKPYTGGALTLTQLKCRKKDRLNEPFTFEAYMLDAGVWNSHDNYLFLLELSAQQLNKTQSRTVQYIHCTFDNHWACGAIRSDSGGGISIFHLDSTLSSMPNDMAGTANKYLKSSKIYISNLPLQNSYGSCPIFSLDSARRLATVSDNLPPHTSKNIFNYFEKYNDRLNDENPIRVVEVPLYLARTWQSSKALDYFTQRIKTRELTLGNKHEPSLNSLQKHMKGDNKKQNTRLEQYELGNLCCHNINFLLDMFSENVPLAGIEAMLSMSTLYGFIDNIAIHFLENPESRMLYFKDLFNNPEASIENIIYHLQAKDIVHFELADVSKAAAYEIYQHYSKPKNLLIFVGILYQLGVADVLTESNLKIVSDWYKRIDNDTENKDIALAIRLFCLFDQSLQTSKNIEIIFAFITPREQESLDELLLYNMLISNRKNDVLNRVSTMKLVLYSMEKQLHTADFLSAIIEIEQSVKKPLLKKIVQETINTTQAAMVSFNNIMAINRVLADNSNLSAKNKIQELSNMPYSCCLNCVVALDNMLDNPLFCSLELDSFNDILTHYNNNYAHAENIAIGIDRLDSIAREKNSQITAEMLKDILSEFAKCPNECENIVLLYSFLLKNHDDENVVMGSYFACEVFNEEINPKQKYSFIESMLKKHPFCKDFDTIIVSILSNKQEQDVSKIVCDWLCSALPNKKQINYMSEQILKGQIAALLDLAHYNSSLKLLTEDLIAKDVDSILKDILEPHMSAKNSRSSLLYQAAEQDNSQTPDEDTAPAQSPRSKH